MTTATPISTIQKMLGRRTVRGFQFRSAIDSFFHHAAEALGVRHPCLVWCDGTQTACVNAKGTVKVANIQDDAVITQATMIKYVGFIIHELLHSKYTDFNVQSSIAYVQRLHNAVEDAYIEHAGIAANLLGNITGVLTSLIDDMVDQALAAKVDWTNPAQYPFALAVYCRRHATQKVPVALGLKPIFDEAFKRTMVAKSSADTLAIAEWVYNQLPKTADAPKLDNDQQDQPKAGDQGDQAGQPQDGDQAGQGDAQDDAPQDGQNGPASADQGQGDGDPKGDPANGADAPDAGSAKPITSRTQAVNVEPINKAPQGQGNHGTYSEKASLSKEGYHVGSSPRITLANSAPARLRFEVKRLFDNSDTSTYNPNQKTGKINTRTLKTIPSGNVNLFKRREEIEGIDSAVVIVLDVSNSMFHYDINQSLISPAVQACAALLDTLSAAHVNTAVVTFGDNASVVKKFGTPFKRSLPLLQAVKGGGGTNDFFALRYAHDMLLGRHEERKICFVITDGDGNRAAVKQQANAGRNLGITTIGIGIFNDISATYGQGITINSIADLGTATFKQIKLAA
jgi:Mg-chelatase subunit ChlD